MSTRVFLGPTLGHADARAILPRADLRPPAALGDVHRSVRDGCRLLVLVDGYFEHVPAVWHKEILFALSEGVRVVGAASMGALRAAELHPYGMTGVGGVFARFRDGVLDGDDEVAVAHEDEEHGFRAVSEPMVNVRAALESAEAEQRIGPAAAAGIVAIGTSMYYPERTWESLLRAAATEVRETELAGLRAFLAERKPDLKRDDAVRALRACQASRLPDPVPAPDFVRTNAWECFLAAQGEP
ncbi:TfuA-like protein [Streptomyces sp. enrichment culture]|uniref:TfuA-like protein n=1 Tax=Streptomyces sp. enrichment culture TaxID=1795815 RepID=UPI003F560995